MKILLCATAVMLSLASQSLAQIRITEWAYQGADGEFVELTNIGNIPIDMTGWSFDDDSGVAGTFDLSFFEIVQPGESVLWTDADADLFRAAWGLGPAIKIIGDSIPGLGRNDQINIFDADDTLVDSLTYGDQDFPGTIRTQNVSGNPISPKALGKDNVSRWLFSSSGDAFATYSSTAGDLGNPGMYTGATVPEPASLIMGAGCLMGLLLSRRRS
jgi:predicted extracellular nuclease